VTQHQPQPPFPAADPPVPQLDERDPTTTDAADMSDEAPDVLAQQTADVAQPAAPGQFQPGQRQQRRQDGPRRIKNGIRFRRKENLERLPWPASAWHARIDARLEASIRVEGLDYARAGQIASLAITPGLVEAVVQGRAPRPYRVSIAVRTLSQSEWDRVVAIMAAEAIWSAKLLSGELPVGVEAIFRSLGRTLVVESDDELTLSCTCPCFADPAQSTAGHPCKHIAAVWALVVERIEADPLLSFTLRGLDGQRLLERLQEARAIATRGVSKAHSTPPAAESATTLPPVERCLQEFWKPGRKLHELPESTNEEHVPHALLRRLGPSPFQAGANRAVHAPAAPARGMPAAPPPAANHQQPTSKFPLVGLLASIYDSMAQAGRKLRDGET
jgi:uncharacterized Zn finger protein